MDSNPDVVEHESCAKRIKLDLNDSNIGELCNGNGFSNFSATLHGRIDICEGVSGDCDSGYEASTLESIPTLSSHQTSPNTDSNDIQESLSSLEMYLTPSHPFEQQIETSQDSVDDDNVSTVSHLSELSGLSQLSGQDWKPMAGSMIWIQKQMQNGVNPRILLSELGVDLEHVPQYVDELTLWKLIINMLTEPPRRSKLRHVNTLDDVVRLIKGAQNIIVLTGAGVSVSCGIPDFRSRDGIYSRLAIDFPNLPDPQAMFDINYFSQDPRPFFKFAKDIYPGKFQPSPCHRFIKILEKYNKLLRNYTQNIDTLEKVANINKVIECHGSFATATCTKCNYKVTAECIRDIVLEQKIPLCELCNNGNKILDNDNNDDYSKLVSSGIMKPDIVFFGEGLPDTFHEAMSDDKTECDLLLVIGSSLKVRPVALIPNSLPSNVPQILINREPLPYYHFDVELLGDCDVIINYLCHLLNGTWKEGIYDNNLLKQVTNLLPETEPNLLCNNCNNNFSTKSSSFNTTTITSTSTTTTFINNDLMIDKINLCKSCNKKMSIINNKENNLIEEQSCSNSNNNNNDHDNNSNSDDIVNSLDDLKNNIKERHMSIDSAKDSGIGDNSNFTDLTETIKYDDDINIGNNSNNDHDDKIITNDDMRGYWQPKIKKSLAERLPLNSFYLIKPNRYIFPGAEVYYDPDDKFNNVHDDDDDEEEDNDNDEEDDDVDDDTDEENSSSNNSTDESESETLPNQF